VLPFHFVDVRVKQRRKSFLAHVDPRPGVVAANVLTVAQSERLPRALRVDQLRRFSGQLKMPYRLIAEWAITTGMRRKELCGLHASQVPATAHLDAEEHPLMGVALKITKGDSPRTTYPPIQLLDRTHRYINEEREPLVRRLRAKRPDYRAPAELFLTRNGRAISKAQLTRVFSAAFRAAGVEGSGHWLRHTFAMTMLVATAVSRDSGHQPTEDRSAAVGSQFDSEHIGISSLRRNERAGTERKHRLALWRIGERWLLSARPLIDESFHR